MKKLVICNQWEIPVDENLFGMKPQKWQPFFQHFSSRRMPELALFTQCWYRLVEYIAVNSNTNVNSVVEYFGGAGRASKIVQGLLYPNHHIIVEYDDLVCEHLRNAFKNVPGVVIVNGDSYELAGTYACDLVSWDEDFTLHRLLYNTKVSGAISRLFYNEPRFVQIADMAASRFPLNRKVYSVDSGVNMNKVDDYYVGLSEVLYKLFGYSISFVARYGKLACVLAEPGRHDVSIWVVENTRDAEIYRKYLRIEEC